MRTFIGHIMAGAGLILLIPVFLKVFELHQISFSVFIIFHALNTIVFFVAFYFFSSRAGRFRKKDNLWTSFTLLMSAMLPFYGIASVILMYLIQKFLKERPPSVIEDEIFVNDPSFFGSLRSRAKSLEVLDRLDIIPFVDVFLKGASAEKKGAIKQLGSLHTKESIKMLLMGLQDPDIEVRLSAGGIIGKIEDEYDRDIKDKVKKYNLNRHDPRLGLAAAGSYIGYAESGLSDKIAKSYYYREAIKVLDEIGSSTEVLFLKARSYLALGELEQAMLNIDECLMKEKDDQNFRDIKDEILFAKRDYSNISFRY